MPKESEVLTGTDTCSKYICKILSFSSHPPTAEETVVKYPVGALVVDSIKEECYEVEPDGSKVYQPLHKWFHRKGHPAPRASGQQLRNHWPPTNSREETINSMLSSTF